jgi:hypothetical protein
MENKNKKRILIGALIVLIIMNLTALGTFGYKKYCNSLRHSRHGEKGNFLSENQNERIKYFVKRELQLDDKQFQKFCVIKDSNYASTNIIWEKLMKFRNASLIEISLENPDTIKLIEISDSIGMYHKKMQIEMNRNFLSVKKLLRPEQLLKYNEMLLNMDKGEWRHHGKDSIKLDKKKRACNPGCGK